MLHPAANSHPCSQQPPRATHQSLLLATLASNRHPKATRLRQVRYTDGMPWLADKSCGVQGTLQLKPTPQKGGRRHPGASPFYTDCFVFVLVLARLHRRFVFIFPRCAGLNSAHASLITILRSFPWLFQPFCCVCHRFAPSFLISNNYLIHWRLHRTPLHAQPFYIWPFPKPWFTHMLWFKLTPWFEQKPCVCVKTTKRCFTQKHTKTVLYTNTMFYTRTMFLLSPVQSAVCGLQNRSFRGARRNTPKALK